MADYAVARREDAPDWMADYPGFGEMRSFTDALGARSVAFTHRLMPPKSGGKGSYGHRHKTQEEVYFVVSGRLQFKLEDEVIDVEAGSGVRVAPEVARSVWNEGPEDAVLIICSVKTDDPQAEAEIVEDFWPD
jgi:mannose-6-phosphate isomerase-like protein (cupin superfamily)